MLESLRVRPRICQRIRSGPLGQWIDGFVDVLKTRGYATSVIRRHVRAAAIFSGWLERQRVAATEIDEALVTRFVSRLPRWRAPERQRGRVSEVASLVPPSSAGIQWPLEARRGRIRHRAPDVPPPRPASRKPAARQPVHPVGGVENARAVLPGPSRHVQRVSHTAWPGASARPHDAQASSYSISIYRTERVEVSQVESCGFLTASGYHTRNRAEAQVVQLGATMPVGERVMRVQVVAVAAVAAIATCIPVAAKECGGDDPRWLLVTHTRTVWYTEDGVQETDLPDEETFIRVCDIAQVSRSERGETRIYSRSSAHLQLHYIVKESPSEICAAIPTCGDATAPKLGRPEP